MSKAMTTRTQSGDRFYNPPARRHLHQQQLLVQQQQQQQQQQQGQLQQPVVVKKQLQRAVSKESNLDPSEADSEGSTLSRPNSVSSSSPRSNPNSTNLDRLMESVTPFVPAHFPSEGRVRGVRSRDGDAQPQPFFCLGDLWETFREWSVYGVGVPLLLSGNESVHQYYVPSLSGIQLYVETCPLRRHGENSDAESSQETSSAGSSDCEAEKRAKGGVDGAWGQHNHVNLNSQKLQRLTLKDNPSKGSSSDEPEIRNSRGQLVYEYLEQEQPHHRKPLYDKVSYLASRFPEIKNYRSCNLSPASWISVAWYPIYRIPMGPTLQNLDASFLTFHSLSTSSKCKNQFQYDSSGRKANGMIASPKIALTVFGLASYKYRGSILTPGDAHEWQQASSLLQDADDWLRHLEVNLPDFQFFASHNSQWR